MRQNSVGHFDGCLSTLVRDYRFYDSMSSMDKLIPCSKERDEPPRDRDSGILFGAFFIFSVACFMFVSYIAVDHAMERSKLQADIEHMEKQVEKLKSMHISASQLESNEELNKEISAMIEDRRRCDPTHVIIRQIGQRLGGGKLAYMDMWDAMPMPFLHLVGRKLTVTMDTENVEGMKTITGWETEGGGGCTESDPTTNGFEIFIPRDGNYSVYSQLTFHTGDDSKTIHRHVVQYVETFAYVRDEPKILMENAYQIASKATKVSYQSGVYRFNKGDILRVLVAKAPGTYFHKDVDETGTEASFGVYLL